MHAPTVRPSPIAGSWYPGTAEAVRAEVGRHLAAVPPRPLSGRLVALIAPHAGLRYSGPVAAHAYAHVADRPVATVVLVGPSHRMAFRGAAVFAAGAFETPLGSAAVDADLADALIAAGPASVHADVRPHREEHSLEMQLPFVQRLLPDARILPVLMGDQSRGDVDALAAALARALAGRDALLVASSDLSHYLPAAQANAADAHVVADVSDFAAERLMTRLEHGSNVACGGGPMVAVLKAARALGADTATVLRYADSGDAGEHDRSRVVGYLAAALHRAEP
ncbi:MAG: AmmeMemoRadiSam system protein B [Vicinamibacteria bacterium]